MTTDLPILQECLTAPGSFAALYRLHVERIYRYHLARTGCEQDAQDLTAETFRAALEARAAYRPSQGAPLAWLMGIARHKLADHFRRMPRQAALEEAEGQADPRPTPEEAAGRRLEMAAVAQALRRLSPERAEALALHFFAGLSLEEVGQAMGKREGAVKKLVQRGLGDLRRELAGALEVKA